MSVHPITVPAGADRAAYERVVHRVWTVMGSSGRTGVIAWDASPITITYTPDLTAQEQTTFDGIVAASRSETGLSPTDYAAVRAQMQILRDLRQLGRNAFVAQTQAQINRQLYDATIAITEIFLKLFRDP